MRVDPAEKQKNPIDWYVISISVILLTAIAIRLIHFCSGYSLWRDELALALNIADRNYLSLLQPLDYLQSAPPLFLLLSKCSFQIFGHSDWSLRLPGVAASMASCFLFWRIAASLFNKPTTVVVTLLFCFNKQFLTYSLLYKQYVFDVLFLLLIFIACRCFIRHPNSFKAWCALLFTGIAAIGFSNPSVFVLAATGSVTAIQLWLREERTACLRLAWIIACWILCFLFLYLTLFKGVHTQFTELNDWKKGLLDLSQGIRVWAQALTHAFTKIGTTAPILVGMFASLGLILGYRDHLWPTLTLAGILIISIIASALSLYSLHDRLTLYLIPVIILLMGIGLNRIAQLCGSKGRWLPALYLLPTLAFTWPQINQALVNPADFQQLRQSIEFVSTEAKPNETIYVFSDSVMAMQFYAPSILPDSQSWKSIEVTDTREFKRFIRSHQSSRYWVMWGRPAKIGSNQDWGVFFAFLNNEAIDYQYTPFNLAHCLRIEPNLSKK